MSKSRFLSILFVLIISSRLVLAQDSLSVQFSGGLISPGSSSNGLTGTVQLNYPINSKFTLYFYSGYASWGKFKVYFKEDNSFVQKQTMFDAYAADDHVLIPIYIGGKFDIHSFKLFKLYFNIELGYSYLSYNSYDILKKIYPETGEVVGYYADASTKQKSHENLFGVGVGAGVSNQIGKNLELVISVKLNSHLNSDYYDFLSSQGTYSMYLVSLNFKI